jgi:predicted glycosyltransferase involved in capsule biosynthesis
MITINDITIIIPIFKLINERKNNFFFILESLFETNIPVVVVEQGESPSEFKSFIENKNKNIKYVFMEYKNDKFNKSKMINHAVTKINTKYFWQVDADVYFKWNDVISEIDQSFDVIKPFNLVIRLTDMETKWFIANKKMKMNKGDVRPTTKTFGPLSFIIKTEIFKKIGMMNEDFLGWSWEDIELAKRLQKEYKINVLEKIYGLHLWHKPSESNEKNNIKVFEKSVKKLELKKSEPLPLSNMIKLERPKKIVPKKEPTKLSEEFPNFIPSEMRKTEFIETEVPSNNFEKYDLSELSVVIPVKIDTEDRLHNLEIVLNFFKNNFTNFNLIVIEQDSKKQLEEKINNFGFDYIFRENYGCFHKTWNFNLAIATTNTKYILAYDCDAIFKPKAIFDALQRLKQNKTSFIYPYNTYMIQIKKHCFENVKVIDRNIVETFPLITHSNTSTIDKNNYELLYGDINWDCTGGAFMFNKKDFFISGGYNPNIISYGCEDNEILVRIKKLGYKLERLQNYNCYHLEHDRSTDSHYNNFFKNNEEEFQKIKNIEQEELKSYVNNGFKTIKFDTRNNLKIINDDNNYHIEMIKNEKIDLSELDIIIPVFVDTNDRVVNVETVLKYLETHFKNYKIYLTEFETNKCKYLYHKIGIEYLYEPSIYNKTKTINYALNRCKNKFVCVWDTDALITPSGVKQALDALKSEKYHFAFPYNGWFIDIRGDTLNEIRKTADVSALNIYDSTVIHPESKDYSVRKSTKNQFGGGANTGGCVLFNRETLNKLGNYNENFWQWGFEDDEIDIRFEIIGYERFNAKNSNCYHMEHSRNDEENGLGTEYIQNNQREYTKVLSMTKQNLESYISNNFLSKLETIALVDDCKLNDDLITHYTSDKNVKEILSQTRKKDKKIRELDSFNNLNERSSSQVILQNVNSKVNTDKILEILSNNRRCIILNSENKIMAYKKEFFKSVINNHLKGFELIKLDDAPMCSIILTTYGKETLMSQEYFERYNGWKTKNYEVIVVVHDETPIHRLLLSHYKNIGIIDKLIFATKDHGHLKGVALGVSEASSDIIINTTNDVRISKDVIDWCVDEIKNDNKLGLIGWHYDNKECAGTFWNDDGSLTYTIRPNSSEELTETQWNKIESSSWYSGKVNKAIGRKRILLCNGSFFCTKKSLWDKIGGMNPDINEHYFADDYYSYGILELGYNIKNLQFEWRDSSKPEVFISMSDYVWRGKEIESKHKNYVNGEDIASEFYRYACENKSVCILGKNTIPQTIKNYKIVKKINEKADCIIINDLVTDIYKIKPYLNEGGVILFDSEFEQNILNSMKHGDNCEVFGNLGIMFFETERKQYSNIKLIKQSSVKIKTDLKKFIVLRQPRVGFNNLKLMLEKNPEIFLDLEIFEDNRTRIGEVMTKERINDPEKFLECYYDLVSTETNKKTIGFSFKTWDKPDNLVEKYLSNNPEMKFILLRRKNSTKAMIDCAWSNISGNWHVTTTQAEFKQFKIDVNWAKGWLTSSNLIYNSWKLTLDDKNINYLEVFYEDLYENLDDGIHNICDFLGVKNVKLWPIFKQSTTDDIYNNITNRDDVNKEFGERFGIV